MPQILVFAASVRSGSYNVKLASEAARRLVALGAEVTVLDLNDYEMPIYNGDLEARDGLPVAARELHDAFKTHQGIFIASPEYNANVSPILANLLVWVSRVHDNGGMAAAFATPIFAIGSASPGSFGGYRGLMALRNSLELQLAARVLPTMVAVGAAHDAFDEDGRLKSPIPDQMLDHVVSNLFAAVSKS
ncbi:NADPH-dependent FMN reductase [Asticcacaulis sp. W401b]|uniref:NADPH-dependent FMN reductase n=1 Tax=Asticcacaulis sp. W401b TaxID=3388666 RepID=UPI003970EAD5